MPGALEEQIATNCEETGGWMLSVDDNHQCHLWWWLEKPAWHDVVHAESPTCCRLIVEVDDTYVLVVVSLSLVSVLAVIPVVVGVVGEVSLLNVIAVCWSCDKKYRESGARGEDRSEGRHDGGASRRRRWRWWWCWWWWWYGKKTIPSRQQRGTGWFARFKGCSNSIVEGTQDQASK